MVQIFPSTNLSPYVHLTRDDRVETAVQNWLSKSTIIFKLLKTNLKFSH